MKTTQKDFETFKQYCEEWRQKLGVCDWSIHYAHDDSEGTYARTFWKLTDMVSTIQFGKHWDDLRPKTDHEINKVALHEVLHLVMAPLTAEAGARFTTQDAIDLAEHRIIRQLENLC